MLGWIMLYARQLSDVLRGCWTGHEWIDVEGEYSSMDKGCAGHGLYSGCLVRAAAIHDLNVQENLDRYLVRMLGLGKDAPQRKGAALAPWSAEMQRAVDHLDLPEKKQRPWTESRNPEGWEEPAGNHGNRIRFL